MKKYSTYKWKTRKWLNPTASYDTDSIAAYLELENLWIDCSVEIRDYVKVVNLSFHCSTARELNNSLNKLDTLIEVFENLREKLPEVYELYTEDKKAKIKEDKSENYI